MGWGCYKHEWDEGSEDWVKSYSELADRKMMETPLTFGRDLAVCPACWNELEERLRVAVDALEVVRAKDGPGLDLSPGGDCYDIAVEALQKIRRQE